MGRRRGSPRMTAPTDRPDRSKRRFHYARAAHRARSHESAHADDGSAAGDGDEDGGGSHHPSIPRGKADLVLTDEQLEQLTTHLRSAGSFAYDSEFIGELT